MMIAALGEVYVEFVQDKTKVRLKVTNADVAMIIATLLRNDIYEIHIAPPDTTATTMQFVYNVQSSKWKRLDPETHAATVDVTTVKEKPKRKK